MTTIILATTFFISAGIVVFLSLKGKEVSVPNLLGKSEGDAEKMLEAEGLRLKVRNRATTEKTPANLISDQTPNSGTVVKAGQVVNVTISTGIEAKKEEAAATPKPTATPRPKPKVSPSPKAESGKDVAGKKPEGEKGKSSSDKGATGKESNKEETGKAKTTLSPKISPKPTPKPSPKKADIN